MINRPFESVPDALSDATNLVARIKQHAKPSRKRSIPQLAITFGAFLTFWLAMRFSLDHAYALTLLLAVPTAGFMVRLFIIQHDCGHGSYFQSRRANDLVGRVLGLLTLTPYDYWRRAHAVHHASSSNLDQRGIGDITTLTVGEYEALGRWRRLAYRLYRHPLVLFGIGPAYLFIVKHRWPLELPILRSGLWVGLLATNLAILAIVVALALAVGPIAFLKLQLPIVLTASSMGVWLFFVQHQFAATSWWRAGEWQFQEAALHGSSYYCLPKALQWLTANIGVHHVHHLCSKVPNYRLQECLTEIPEMRQVGRVTLLDSLKCARLALWDEDAGRMIGFRDLRRLPAVTR